MMDDVISERWVLLRHASDLQASLISHNASYMKACYDMLDMLAPLMFS